MIGLTSQSTLSRLACLVNQISWTRKTVRRKTPLQADKILAAAATLFATHRFHEARMEDIAALAEVGKGTLYRYFRDKEELYTALLERASLALHERLHQGLEKVSGPREQLIFVVQGIIDYFDANPHLFDVIQHAEAMQKPGAEFPWQQTRRETMGLVKGILRRGQESGLFAIDDLELAVLMLLGGMRAVLRFGARPRPACVAEGIVAGFLRGYGAGECRRAEIARGMGERVEA
jgi:AcrR family transcriptional regulator